ncbi:hypothetical protein FHS96_000374 [Sphingomonas zeicaulis]|uniref:hypothetical protein n=1 Tax=Sphingomonas zeicaulis TaxID=1632740 RepID=UPI003D248041
MPDTYRLFLRADFDPIVKGTLPNVNRTHTSPAQHMSYDGVPHYFESGYLSLFEYIPAQAQRSDCTIVRAMGTVRAPYIHAMFIPATVRQIAIDETTVRLIPNIGGQPALLNTDLCTPPARIDEMGNVLAYASRFINEYLYCGPWAQGTQTHSFMWDRFGNVARMMNEGKSPDEILAYCDAQNPLGDMSAYG